MRIPSSTRPILKQTNSSSVIGDITDSFNLDLTKDLGKIKATKTLLSKISTSSITDTTDFGSTQALGVGGFAILNNTIYMISGSNIWVGGNSPSDAVVIDAQSGTPAINIQTGDIKTFNSKLYATSSAKIYSSSGAGWSEVYTYGDSVAHLLENHKGYLYFTYANYKVGRLSTADASTVSGTGSLNLNLAGFEISFMKSDGDYLWIGLVNTSGGHDNITYIYKWDGSTADQAQIQYKIDSRSILAGCIVNGVPYVVDGDGRLLGFNGAFFEEKDRFPLKEKEYLYSVGTTHDRGIHPNGMIYDPINREILINVANIKEFTSNVPSFYDWTGGVWGYTKETGLYHKYSASLQPIANTGTTGLVDYGQSNIIFAGAITTLGLRSASTEKGRVLFGQVIFKGISADYTTANSAYVVLCANDTADTSQKYAYFITTEIHSSNIQETWQGVYAMYKNLLNSTDKIIVKYKTKENVPTQANITWDDINIISTTTDVSAYTEGDEIQVIQGYGSGKSFNIQSISESGGTYTIILDDSMPSGVIGLRGVVKFSNWIKLGEVTNTDELQYKLFTLFKETTSPMIRLKCAMQFTGDNELDSLYIKNKNTIK